MFLDAVVIGGGIVGLATAREFLLRRPADQLVVLEKESDVGMHQSGRNSGVLHSGIYYRPGSLKAINCREGKRAMEEFCQAEQIPFELCGKVIVATREDELPRLAALHERGVANGVRCQRINRQQLAELEPHAAGIEAIHVPETGIVDYRAVCHRLAEHIAKAGSRVVTGARVQNIRSEPDRVVVETTAGEFVARRLVNCAGLQSDRVTKLAGLDPQARIVPFRGEYFSLRPPAQRLCRGLIYPVPDPQFPFLGVHFTRMIDGGVECGPNAVLSLAREGYNKLALNPKDAWDIFSYAGFWRLASRHWRMGLAEIGRSLSKRAFAAALQRLIPEITAADLVPAPSGIRAQLLAADGNLEDDFALRVAESQVHICNAPSPAATASLAIAKQVVDQLLG